MKYLDPKSDEVILDIGSAGGNYTVEIARKVKLAVAIEHRWSTIRHLSKTKAFGGGLVACTADALKLPFADKSFDKILLSGTLQSLDARSSLYECARVVKPGGSLIITVLADHILIRKFYNRKKTFLGLFLGIVGIPAHYTGFQNEYCHKHIMTQYYSDKELNELLSDVGFRLEASQYAPSGLAAILLDFLELLTWRRKVSLIGNRIFFPMSYPLFWLAQKVTPKDSLGNEWVAKFSAPVEHGIWA
jgi:ubiquinone/menaquinone biosynthesis C-methylase UbiE